MVTAIIVAGGNSRRMGFDKTFALLAGRPAIAHSIAAFEAAQSIEEVILVGKEERLAELNRLVAQHAFGKVRAVVPGGADRQDSVNAGLDRVDPKSRYVAVHDAARPLVRPAQIELVIEQARRHGAAALAAPVTDTLKHATDERLVCGSIERKGVYAMQTPQVFLRALLSEAFRAVKAEQLSITDEVSAVEYLGREVVLVENTEFNFKITYAADLALAEAVIKQRAMNKG